MSTRAEGKFWSVLGARRGWIWAIAISVFALGSALSLGLDGRSTSANAQSESAGAGVAGSGFSDAQKKDIEGVIRSYLLENPKLLLEVEQKLKDIVAQEEAVRMKKSIAANADFLFGRGNAPKAGNPNGDIPVVEFFDYNCGYCKRSLKDISDLIAKDPKIKVVFMEYPILSKGSMEAAIVALASRNQGKYWPVHSALLQHRGSIDGKVALKIAKAQGLDMTVLQADMESKEIKAELERVATLAQSMDINGTPHFLVGDRGIAGAPRDLLDQILKNAAELRKEGCSVC